MRPAVGYALHGGQADAHRLATMARILEPSTDAFLTRLGIRPGWRCLDVGCGHGQVSLLLASRIRPGGRVVAVDGDPASLRVARRNAADVGAAIGFLSADAGGLPAGRGKFDLAYCRFLLGHLTDPLAALRAMAAAVRPGGTVAVEDGYFTLSTLATLAPVPALAELADVLSMTIRVHGGDPMIGPRLPALLAAAGLVDITVDPWSVPGSVLPLGVSLLEMLDAARAAAAEAGVATPAQLDRLRRELGTLSEADLAEVGQPTRLYQVAGHRPLPVRARAAA
ncbi:class I SAM-dependent methyltransferase [Frankia sp. CNm7]|uniref:class I SAM-dependent methyltransferase n=1 Tax=Frankia nepalensis TaxID=1836974 RepID=UPI001933A879|nr:class I SAM-dependent methyltransferase [Frankia nepalensis]MBL7521231.1 class I SAM-dependent methyltransferase [Frankia nepalensis]